MTKLEEAYELRNKKINKIEKLKEESIPLDFFNSLKELSKLPYEEAFTDAQKKHFLKCFGIYDKGSSDTFAIRIRIPAGQLSVKQALHMAKTCKTYGNDYIDLTTRAQMEFRYLKLPELPTVLEELESVGITTFQTAGDNLRGVTTSPFDGLSKSEKISCRNLVDEIQSVFLKNEDFIGTLPRKFNTSILGDVINDCNIFGHDCAFALAKKDEEYGFNIYVGGKVGVQARPLDIFVKENQVKKVFECLLNLFKIYGFRDNRNKNRLNFLLDAVSLEEFKKALIEESQLELKDAGELLVKEELEFDDISVIKLKDNKSAVHFCIPSGVFNGSDLKEAGEIAQELDGEIRLTYEQSFYIICNDNDLQKVKDSKLYKKYASYHNIYFNNQIACAGTNECSFGVIANKPDAIDMANYLNKEVPLENGKVRMYWSACPKGCGIHGVADIGFEGAIAKDEEGNRCDGVKIFLGGKATKSIKEARQITKAVTLDEAKVIVKNLISFYKNKKLTNESFEDFETRTLSHLGTDELNKIIN